MTATPEQTPEQKRLGDRCKFHADMVIAMTSVGDVPGAEDYLDRVTASDGAQMATNVTDLIALRLAILPPDML